METNAIENMTLEELKVHEEELKGQVPRDVVGLNRVQDRITQLEAEHEQQAAQQVRIQAQEEKVATITLPYDFNDLFSDEEYKNAQGQPHKITVANDMFIELAQDLQRKAYDSHNVEIQTLLDAHKEELRLAKEEIRAAGEREIQLKHQNDELQAKIEAETKQAQADAIEHSSLLQQIAQLQLDKQDSDSKRDAAVKQLEEAHAEIVQLKQWNDDLRAQAAHGVRKAIDIIDISPSEKLAAMVKETTEQKANRALTRWSEIMPEVVAPPVVPAGPAVFQPEHTQASDHPSELVHTADPAISSQDGVTGHTFQVHSGDAMDPGVSSENGKSGEAVSRKEFEDLKGRVDSLYRHANLPTAV